MATLVAASGLLGAWWAASTSTPAQAPTAAPSPPSPVLACTFEEGERSAFDVSSSVRAADVVDHFEGVLSWEAAEVLGESALLRAAFTDVRLEQSLSGPRDRTSAAAIEGAPFFVRVDRRCRFTEIGFTPAWPSAGRQLVTTVLRAAELVLPGDASTEWEAAQVDGGGAYVAHYSATTSDEGVRIVRMKPAYDRDAERDRFGIELAVLRSRADATFDAEAGALQSLRGDERVQIALPDGTAQRLTHRFAMQRRDAAFAQVAFASLSDADFGDALHVEEEVPMETAIDPALAALERSAARDRFNAFFARLGSEGVYPAARFLAAWLRANPEESGLLLDELRRGEIEDVAQASFFLAFELAGTDASREVLVTALDDAELSDVNRARAASALADHGAPSREVADALLARAHEDESSTVATVSRLGLGSLAGRADGELGADLRDVLHTELEGANSRSDVVAAIDAIGNCGDDRFAPAVGERLAAEDPSVRAHAAEALGQLSPEVARPHLIAHLGDEEDPRVAASVLRGLRSMDGRGSQLSEADLALAAARLASPDAEIRGGLIEWLGQSASRPDVRRVLAGHFSRESDLRLKQRLGAFVSAADLRNAD